MPQLPFVCISCRTVYQRAEVSRPVKFGETAAGFCPDCNAKQEAELYGGRTTVIGTFSKRWCG